MPKLGAKEAKSKKEKANDSSFEPLEEGVYHVKLESVEVSDNPGPSGSHYWKWQFDIVEPETSGKLWNNTSLSDKAAFKLQEAYDAFDAEFGSDTDELVGSVCKAVVSQQIIQSGARKGEVGNQIDRLVPKDEDFEVPETAGAVKGEDGEDLF